MRSHKKATGKDASDVYRNLLITFTVATAKLEPAGLVAKHW